MIAIAGAKGGCGKTTTTLGLAQAFGRAGFPTLVVDSDRQMPNIHVAAGIDRDPTVADLHAGIDVTAVTQTHPDFDHVKLLPAPHSDDDLDFGSVLENLKHDSVQTLVDCPAGVGPDATEPLAVADEVIVVTSMTKQSLVAAEKTIDVASQLDTKVLGIVLNKVDSETEDAREKVPFGDEIPILQTVPNHPSPLEGSEPSNAYDSLVLEYLDTTVSTGIPALDEEFDGGFPGGSIVDITATPDSQSELLLHALTTTKQTLYITTEKSEELLAEILDSSDVPTGSPSIQYLGDGSLEKATQLIQALPPDCHVIIDSMNLLEENETEEYLNFLHVLVEQIRGKDSIALLHNIKQSEKSRNRSSTEQFADILVDFEAVQTGDETEYQFSVLKSRTGSVPTKTITLTTEDFINH